MNKILTLNTIKNVFSSLGAKTSDSNYAVGLFDKTSAEPKGIMGMSDLASVLGGIKSGDINTTEALNSCKENGKYYVSNRIEGAAFTTAHTLLVIKVTDYVTQIAINVATLQIAGRSLLDRTGQTWDSWQRIDNYGTSSLSELASLLGEGYLFKSQEDTYTDLNDMRPGIFYNGNMPTIQNAPSEIISTSSPQCVVLCVKNGSGNRGMAFAFSALGVATRFFGAGGWTAWKSKTLT